MRKHIKLSLLETQKTVLRPALGPLCNSCIVLSLLILSALQSSGLREWSPKEDASGQPMLSTVPGIQQADKKQTLAAIRMGPLEIVA